jgi:hypothetical protein
VPGNALLNATVAVKVVAVKNMGGFEAEESEQVVRGAVNREQGCGQVCREVAARADMRLEMPQLKRI